MKRRAGPRALRASRPRPRRSRGGRRRRGRTPDGGCDFTCVRARRAIAASRVPASTATSCSEKTPAPAVHLVPTASGTCWSRSPPRATLSTCEPRQIGEHRQVALERSLQQRQLEVVALADDARRLGMRLLRRTAPDRDPSRPRRPARRARRASPRSRPRSAARGAAAAGPRDRADVRRRDQRRRSTVPARPTCAVVGVRRDADTGRERSALRRARRAARARSR